MILRKTALLLGALLSLQVLAAPMTALAYSDPAENPFAPATPATEAVEEAPPWAGEHAVAPAAAGSYYGRSGLNPYQAFSSLPEDEVFIADMGGRLDQYLCRSQGPITFNVNIDRVYGAIASLSGYETYNNLQNPGAAIANGLIEANATLYLRVYDVDHDYQGGYYAPEVDYVNVNGHRLQGSLTSGNNRWDTVSFQVPIQQLLFPAPVPKGSTPANAPNEIRIDIDVANTDEVWCVEVDWAVLHLEAARPAVLVNGILSNDHAWDAMRPMLWQRGLPNYAQELDATSGIFHNAADLANEMDDIKASFGVDRINIIAHSKGGLDSRAYMRSHSDVDHLIQLATPNRGSDCAQALLANLLGSTWDLDPDWIYRNFNYRDTRKWFWEPHNYVPNWTEYGTAPIHIFAGTKFNTTSCPVGIGDPLDPPHDSVVSHDRATLPWNWNGVDGDGIDQGVTDAQGPYDHSEIHDAAAVADQIVAWIAESAGISSASASTQMRTADAARTLAAASPAGEPARAAAQSAGVQFVEQAGGRLSAGESVTKRFVLDAVSQAQVAVLHNNTSTAVTLLGPDGAPVAADLVGVPAGMQRATVFNLASPAPGEYAVEVAAAQDDIYVLEVRAVGGMALNASASAEFAQVGEEVTVSASLVDESGSPVLGAQVTAELYQPGGASELVALTEQADGTYAGAVSSQAAGRHVIVLRAVTDAAQRAASLVLTVLPEGSELAAPTESTFDVDGDGLYDALLFEFTVDLEEAGLYILDGDLYDGQGQLIQRQSVTTEAAAGRSSLYLGFDGRTIAAHGADGPYTLDNVVLRAVDLDSVPVAVMSDPYTTQPYLASDFQHERLLLTGGSDQGQDTDGDGLFNRLLITLDFDVAQTGWYQASGRLVTAAGAELGWSSGSAYIDGQGSVSLAFDGRQIRAGGVDGPYRLIDLMVQGPQLAVIPEAYVTSAYSVRQFQSIDADLVVEPGRITASPTEPAPGQAATLTAVVENRGSEVGGTFPVAFYLGNPAQGGTLIGEVEAAAMAAESEQPVTIPWTAPEQPGQYEIYVVLNASRVVREFDYSNNTTYAVIAVSESDEGPVTTVSVTPAPNAAGWHSTPVEVTLSASGASETYWQLNGAGWQRYEGPVVIDQEGIHTFGYYSAAAGREEAAQEMALRIDMTAPVVEVALDPAAVSLLAPVVPTITVTDALDPNPEVTALLDGEPYAAGTPVEALGEHELIVTAADAAGNQTEVRSRIIVADRPTYAAYLRGLLDQLRAEVDAANVWPLGKAMTTILKNASERLEAAEDALEGNRMKAFGQLVAARAQVEAFRHMLNAATLSPEQRAAWEAQAAAIQAGLDQLLDSIDFNPFDR